MLRPKLSRLLRRVGEHHLRRQIRDPELRARLTPRYEPGCKRILISNDYLPSLTRPNVEVLTEGIAEIRGRRVIGTGGSEREVDTIILGTGFHVTDMPIGDRVRGRDGRTLAEVWRGSPQAHRGTTVAGFPNLFFLLGPNTGLGHNSVVYMAEAQTRYVRQALDHLRRTGMATVEPRPEAQAEWNEAIQRRMPGTVWMTGGCASWYIDENGMNTTLWPDFSYRFAAAVRRFDPAEHVLAPARAPIPAEPITTPRLDLCAI